MGYRSFGRRAKAALRLFSLVMGSVPLAACGHAQYDELFQKQIAPPALTCFHPMGQFGSVSAVERTGDEAFKGAIYWKGGISGNSYVTHVEVRIADNQATVTLLEDSATVPAAEETCRVPILRAS